jgi:hypothetical protein
LPGGPGETQARLSRDDLAEQREQWITIVCTRLVGTLSGHPALDPAGIAPELDDPVLARALLVARIAALAGGGRSTGDISRLLVASRGSTKTTPTTTYP